MVENAGFGASSAAPIARRVIDFVLQGVYPSEADLAATRLGQSTVPTGTPRPVATVPLPGVTIDGSTASLGPQGIAAPLPAAVPASAASAVQRVAAATGAVKKAP